MPGVRPHVCYGGTFDPVHNGHLAIARAVVDVLSAPVHLLPAADPPHRAAPGASAEQRACMLELAVAGDPRLQVDRRELARPGRSYSIDTLRQLRGELGPQTPLVWVIGGDSLLQLHTWKDWRQLFRLAHILAVPRPGLDLSDAALVSLAPEVAAEVSARRVVASAFGAAPGGLYAGLALGPLRVESATEIRRRIAAGQPWQAWVPPPVAAYIREHRLYQPGESNPGGQGV